MFSETAKNEMLDGTTVNRMSLHNGDPGASGTDNEIAGGGYSRQAATFNAAGSAERVLNADVTFSGPASDPVTHFGVWEADDPDVFKGSEELTGDAAFNSEGEYIVTTPGTKLKLTDPV